MGPDMSQLSPLESHREGRSDRKILKLKDKQRTPKCARCRNHRLEIPVKGHKRYCTYQYCECKSCILTINRRAIMATQVSVRRAQAQDEARAAEMELTSSTSVGPEAARPGFFPGSYFPAPPSKRRCYDGGDRPRSPADHEDSKDQISVTEEPEDLEESVDESKPSVPILRRKEPRRPSAIIKRVRAGSRAGSKSPPAHFHHSGPGQHDRTRISSREAQDMSIRSVRRSSSENGGGVIFSHVGGSSSSLSSISSVPPAAPVISPASPVHTSPIMVTTEAVDARRIIGPKIYPHYGLNGTGPNREVSIELMQALQALQCVYRFSQESLPLALLILKENQGDFELASAKIMEAQREFNTLTILDHFTRYPSYYNHYRSYSSGSAPHITPPDGGLYNNFLSAAFAAASRPQGRTLVEETEAATCGLRYRGPHAAGLNVRAN